MLRESGRYECHSGIPCVTQNDLGRNDHYDAGLGRRGIPV
jgi:hypothetical protein